MTSPTSDDGVVTARCGERRCHRCRPPPTAGRGRPPADECGGPGSRRRRGNAAASVLPPSAILLLAAALLFAVASRTPSAAELRRRGTTPSAVDLDGAIRAEARRVASAARARGDGRRRRLSDGRPASLDDYVDELMEFVDGDEYVSAATAESYNPNIHDPPGPDDLAGQRRTTVRYTVMDALSELRRREARRCGLLVYDPPSDSFVGLLRDDAPLDRRAFASAAGLAQILRAEFPGRFSPGSDEFAVPFGSLDYPTVRAGDLPVAGAAPVLNFGTVHLDPSAWPNLVGMPTAGVHLGCFVRFALVGDVCDYFARLPAPADGADAGWEGLTPAVFWRGREAGYLDGSLVRPRLVPPAGPDRVGSVIEDEARLRAGRQDTAHAAKFAATITLRKHYDVLLPRWKGATLSAEAELSAADGGPPSPFDVRFSDPDGPYADLDIGNGTRVSPEEMARYRYHIDLAGLGGTTWTGTWTRLGMPGLLFHHMTPMRDYVHRYMRPWVHYVPVRRDLSDLREKYDRMEADPALASRIARQATELRRRYATPEGFGVLHRSAVVDPLRDAVRSYQPVESFARGFGWLDVVTSPQVEVEFDDPESGRSAALRPIVVCSGDAVHDRDYCNWYSLPERGSIDLASHLDGLAGSRGR